jgi:hypothetical protein
MREWKVITRLDPSKMTIDYNPATYEKKYKWTVPESTARIVRNKKPKEEYDKIPDMIKRRLKRTKPLFLITRTYITSPELLTRWETIRYGEPQ